MYQNSITAQLVTDVAVIEPLIHRILVSFFLLVHWSLASADPSSKSTCYFKYWRGYHHNLFWKLKTKPMNGWKAGGVFE